MQPQRAEELGAQQAAYEALYSTQLKKVTHVNRDLIWAATEQCGLGSAPLRRSAAPPDAATAGRAARRNERLREEGVSPIPWDHVTEWEVSQFLTGERGVAVDSKDLKQLLKYAANFASSVCNVRGESQQLWPPTHPLCTACNNVSVPYCIYLRTPAHTRS